MYNSKSDNRVQTLFSKTNNFYEKNKSELFEEHGLEISRLFTRKFKRKEPMHLADEMWVAERINYLMQKDIRKIDKYDALQKKIKRAVKRSL